MCGNYSQSRALITLRWGSPPRVRELLEEYRRRVDFSEDHPRVCGNYERRQLLYRAERGSPPRVRELRRKKPVRASSAGITPACAGITPRGALMECSGRDHPRVCGNYLIIKSQTAKGAGSPPRVRELLAFPSPQIFDRGITPACAGITLRRGKAANFTQDHPRVCGNYVHKGYVTADTPGSPPRVRELPCRG